MTDTATANADTAEEMQRLVGVFRDALTDGMVERAAGTYGNLLEVVDHMAEPDTMAAVHAVLDELTTLHQTGGLTTLFETIHFLNAMRNAATDGMVERGAIFMETMVNNLATEELANLASCASTAIEEASEETARTKHPGGLFATIGMLSKPETQASLHFLLTIAQKMQARR
jgi:uncharacterized protein YjgD (DUF1641 family)